MRAVGIIGSPRKDGNSAYLTRELLGSLARAFETELIFLSQLDIHPCNGCHSCVPDGKCIIDDGMQAVHATLKDASVVILSSPVYMGGITSRLRLFMERAWPLRTGSLKGKICSYLVLGRRDLGVAVAEMEEFFSRIGAVQLPGIIGYGYNEGDIQQDAEAMRNTVRLANDILELSSKLFKSPDDD
nr:flavodoxin family protein [Candidatus Sigynarchaeum springense]